VVGGDAARGVVRYCTWDTVTAAERIAESIERRLANCEKTVHPANKQSAVLRTTTKKRIKI